MSSLSRPQEKAHESCGIPLRALGWSLGLHLLLLGGLAELSRVDSSGKTPTAPLQAMLRPLVTGVPAIPPAPTIEPLAGKPRVSEPDKRAETTTAAVSPAPTFASRSDAAPVAAPVGGFPVAGGVPEPATVALPMPVATAGPDAAGLRQYRLALAGAARHFRLYPEAARREGVTGTAEVRVSVTAGTQRQAELARSSGHAVLDAAALEMLRAAAARANVPESLRGHAFAVLLPVVFEVEE